MVSWVNTSVDLIILTQEDIQCLGKMDCGFTSGQCFGRGAFAFVSLGMCQSLFILLYFSHEVRCSPASFWSRLQRPVRIMVL